MDANERRRKTDVPVAAILVSALILNGCHTMTRVALPDAASRPPNAVAFAELKAGDDVKVTLKTGETLSCTVSEVRADGLVAVGGRHIAHGDIAALEKQSLSAAKTTLLVIGVTVGAACLLIVVALFADSGGLAVSPSSR